MTTPFFLTRQSANLMEDFARELNAGPMLFLLYGEPGVGKTRLLRELMQNRLAESRVHWIEFTRVEDDVNLSDYSAEIESIFDSAREGDIIIADHFEEALKKPRHQLFLSWSTDGIDKKLNLIVITNQEGFNELRQLSMQYQVKVQSFQLMPFSRDEVNAFLGFFLFPEQAADRLSIPAPLRKQLAATNGVIGTVIDLARREGKNIKLSSGVEPRSIRHGSRIILGLLMLVVIAVGAYWYLFERDIGDSLEITQLGNQTPTEQPSRASVSAEASVDDDLEPGDADQEPVANGNEPSDHGTPAAPGDNIGNEADVAIADSAYPEPAGLEAATGQQQAIPNPEVQETTRVQAAEAAADSVPEQDQAATEASSAASSESVNALETAAVSDDNAANEEAYSDANVSARFERDLTASKQWLADRQARSGTIQIMSLGYERFDEAVYYRYLDELGGRQVDVSRIRVFKSVIAGDVVYGVFYGEYDSRQRAAAVIDQLPAALREIGPIPRSVGGIRQEISRLEKLN